MGFTVEPGSDPCPSPPSSTDVLGPSFDGKRVAALGRYYRLHARIYDATRWSFLFGRVSLLERLSSGGSPSCVLEVGCGTGTNLAWIARHWPGVRLLGIDTSDAMLKVARRKLTGVDARAELRLGYYHRPLRLRPAPDLVLFSYCLSMIAGEGQVRAALDAACADLAVGGRLAVVDFHDSGSRWFRRWMARNHVRMEGDVLPHLGATLATEWVATRRAYFGTWRWFGFVGRKRGDGAARVTPA